MLANVVLCQSSLRPLIRGNARKKAQMLANVAGASLARCHVTHEHVSQSAQGERRMVLAHLCGFGRRRAMNHTMN
jgi:hypothetical protein